MADFMQAKINVICEYAVIILYINSFARILCRGACMVNKLNYLPRIVKRLKFLPTIIIFQKKYQVVFTIFHLSARMLVMLVIIFSCACNDNDENESNPNNLFEYNSNVETRWSSPENRTGEKGAGGRENNSAKGHPYDTIAAGQSYSMLDIRGSGMER
jgi:hypothetical protein